jgi:predicted MFS family arabinose efflux permease
VHTRAAIAIAVGLALADASVVVLALPPLLPELGTTVQGVAAVIAVYTLVLAVALPLAERLRRARGTAFTGLVGWGLFGAAAIGCGLAQSLGMLLVLRAVQALGAAGGIVSGFALLRDREADGPGALWTAATVFGTAAGPALGGVLTELFDWRAIFFAQVPFAVWAAARSGAQKAERRQEEAEVVGEPRGSLVGPAIALALLSAALTGVLFLLVLMLVTGWSLSPATAALAVSILPVAAIAGARVRGEPRALAAAGCALVGAGVLALAWVPTASVAWTVPSQLLAGLGMGMGFAALAGPLLPERTPGQAAALLSVRHAGITVALVLIAPVAAAQLDHAVANARQRTAAVVLDAKLPPLDKINLVGPITADLDPVAPRRKLHDALERQKGRYADDPAKRAAYKDLVDRVDGTVVRGVGDAFRTAFLIAGALALLGAAALVPGGNAATRRYAAYACAALLLPLVFLLTEPGLAPARGEIADPCKQRDLPHTGGITGFAQDLALVGLDRAACKFGSTREELAIAIADDSAARQFERDHGVAPRSLNSLLNGVVGGNPAGSLQQMLEDALGGG